MATERSRSELDWTLCPASSEPLTASSNPADAAWSSAVQPETTPRPWDQLLVTGSRNNSSDGGVTSPDDNANWASKETSRDDSVSYGGVRQDVTGSEVFSDLDYHVIRRHVMQGDSDDHVKSLDSRE